MCCKGLKAAQAGFMAPVMAIGVQTLTGRLSTVPRKPRAATPTTVNG